MSFLDRLFGKKKRKIDELNERVVQLYQQGQYQEAIPLAVESLDLVRQLYGDELPIFATSLNNLAGLYVATARARDALPLMQQAAAIDDRMIGQIFSMGSENQRTAHLKTLEGNLDILLSLVAQSLWASPVAVRTALDVVLRRKALGAEALAAQQEAILGGQYPQLAPQLQALTILRSQIAQKTWAGPGRDGPAAHRQVLDVDGAEGTARRRAGEADSRAAAGAATAKC